MTGGIIAFGNTEDKKAFKIINYTIENTGTIFVCKFCCSYSSFSALKLKKQKKLLKRCIKLLLNFGVECLYLPGDMNKNSDYKSLFERFFALPDGSRIISDMADTLAVMYASNLGIKLMDARVGICADTEKEAVDSIRKMSVYTKHITLFTTDTDFGKRCGELIFDSLGMCIGISDNISHIYGCDIIILKSPPKEGVRMCEAAVIDASGSYPGRAVRGAEFSLPPQVYGLKDFADICDGRFCEFIMNVCAKSPNCENIRESGFVVKNLLYTF